jgi:hypothetical protein
MTWFTYAGHVGAISDEESDAAIVNYHRHLADLAASAPPGLRELGLVNLHDGQVQEWQKQNSRFRWRVLIGDLQVGYQFAEIEYRAATLTVIGEEESSSGSSITSAVSYV